MKKLTKLHFILIAVLVVVIAAAVFFSFSYQGAEAKQPDIRNEINLALMNLEIAKLENDPTQLQEQLAELQGTLNSLTRDEPLFPEEPPIVDIGDLIIDSVDKLKLTLLTMKSEDEAGTVTIESDDEKSKGNKYSKAEYEVKVKGDLGRIVSLIGEIEGASFTTLTLEDIELTYEEEEDENEKVFKYWIGEFTIITLYEYEETD